MVIPAPERNYKKKPLQTDEYTTTDRNFSDIIPRGPICETAAAPRKSDTHKSNTKLNKEHPAPPTLIPPHTLLPYHPPPSTNLHIQRSQSDTMTSRDDLVYMAKLAEQAER